MPKGKRAGPSVVAARPTEASALPKGMEKVETESPNGVRPQQSPLATYLKVNGLSSSSFAIAMGVPLQSVRGWETGTLPSLPAAYEIERLTKGAIPMEAWLSVASAKELLLGWREKQKEEVRGNRAETPGGFAQPVGKRGSTP